MTKRLLMFGCLFAFVTLHAQTLGELQWAEVRDVTYIFANPEQSLLIVESTVAGLSFESNRGILSADEQEAGVWHVRLEPGVQAVTIRSDGFLPLTLPPRPPYAPKSVRKIRVTAIATPLGRGSLAISSEPPGASIRLDQVELDDRTPVTLERLAPGAYLVEVFGLPGYVAAETTVVVQNDHTTRLDLRLKSRLVQKTKLQKQPERSYWDRITDHSAVLRELDHIGVGTYGLPHTDGLPMGGNLWLAFTNIRLSGGWAKIKFPDLYSYDGFEDLHWTLYDFHLSLYPDPRIRGFWFGSGVTHVNATVSHKNTSATGTYETVYVGGYAGWTLQLFSMLHVDMWGGWLFPWQGDKYMSVEWRETRLNPNEFVVSLDLVILL